MLCFGNLIVIRPILRTACARHMWLLRGNNGVDPHKYKQYLAFTLVSAVNTYLYRSRVPIRSLNRFGQDEIRSSQKSRTVEDGFEAQFHGHNVFGEMEV